MSSNITLTAATRQNLLSLQGTADLLTTTQNRLSTGKKVTSALDNPINFFTSQSLSARSNDLSGLLDGLSNGVQTIQAANQGITSLQKLVDSAKSTAQQALADKSGGKGIILGGVPAQSAVATGTSAVTGTVDLSTLAKDASVDISLDGGVTKNTLRIDSSTLKSVTSDTSKVTTDQLVTALNGQIAGNSNLAGKVSASIGTNGRISFTTTDTGAAAKLSVSGSLNATTDIGFGKPATTPLAATVVGSTAAPLDFTNTKNSVFTVSDGNKSVTVSLDSTTATDAIGGTLGTTTTTDKIKAAINKQLSDGGSTVTAGVDVNGKLTFTSQDLGPDAQLSVNGVSSTAGGANGIGFTTFAAFAGTQSTPAVGSKTTNTGNVDLSTATPSLTGGKSATFTITDGVSPGTATTVTIDSTSLDTPGIGAGVQAASGQPLGNTPSADKIASAITAKLKAQGSDVIASIDSGTHKLTFTAAANGANPLLVSASNDTIGLGFGTSAAASGAFTAGSAPPVVAIIAGGTDASDGSSKASITGGSIDASVYNTSTKLFALTSPANASFTLQLGSGATKAIDLTATTKIDKAGTTLGATPTQASVAQAINYQISQDTGLSGKVQASFVNDKLTIQTVATGSDQSLTVKSASTVDIGLGLATNAVTKTTTGTDVGGAKGDSSTRSTLATQYNNLLTQISQQAQDAGYNGVNLLFRNGASANENTLRLTFNEKGTSNLDIAGVKFDADGLGLKSSANNFQTDDEINTALNQLTTATATLRAQSSTFGSNLSVVQNRQDFSKNIINILDTGSANLTNADLNEEAANSQALSTRQSIGISALSLANTAQQGILQLLR